MTLVPTVEARRPTSFSITFGRRPKMIALVRRFVEDFYRQLYDEIVPPLSQHQGWASQVSLAAHELVENAVRHGLEGDAVFSITVEVDPDMPDRAHTVRLCTRNRAKPIQCERVTTRLKELAQADDLFAYYLELMTASVTGTGGSGLGLARIRVEAHMDLSCTVEGGELEVAATAYVSTGKP